MSERLIKLCERAVNWDRINPRNDNSRQCEAQEAHSPELLLALWECYEALKAEVADNTQDYFPAVKHVEELTNE